MTDHGSIPKHLEANRTEIGVAVSANANLGAASETAIDPAEVRVTLYAELGESYDDWVQQTAIHFAF
jgi:hypothetical protein